MTWMKAGEFECENGCKAVVVGRLPNPVDGASAWYGYSVYKDSGRSMHAQWNDDGRCAGNRNYNLKPHTQLLYMAVSALGNIGVWQSTLKDAVSFADDVQFVLAVPYRLGKIADMDKIVVYMPDGPTCWKQMGLHTTFVKTITATPNAKCTSKVKHNLSEEF